METTENKYNVIATRRDSTLQNKSEIYDLLDRSYIGGTSYTEANYLTQYDREYSRPFKQRQKRSVYFNFLQPIVDILAGFILKEEPTRRYPENLEYLIKNTSKQSSLNTFMTNVVTKSSMYTVGVLVDSPTFDSNDIRTQADRDNLESSLNPYAVLYHPHQIRDFSYDGNNNLRWVLLDNTTTIKDDPFIKTETKKVYRLWTKTHYQDFELDVKDSNGKSSIIAGDEMSHPIGYVPFHFVNWRDVDGDFINDSPFEDIAIISKQIYQIMSLLDEMLHSGTIKTLFFPEMSKGDVPDDIKKNGIYDIPLVTFNGETSQAPFFAGADLGNVAPFKEALNLYILEIFRKIGMDVDRDKSYTQSGVAMAKEFQKTEALLKSGVQAAESTEIFIFKTAARWENTTLDDSQLEISYSQSYNEGDIDARLARLRELYVLSFGVVQEKALGEIVKLTMPRQNVDELLNDSKESVNDGSWLTKAVNEINKNTNGEQSTKELISNKENK